MIKKEDIVKLREETGAGIMDAKKALEETGGDFDEAKKIISKKGLDKAAKREGRDTAAGKIEAYLHNGRVGVLVELRTETDFVANSEPFLELVHELALQLAAVPVEGEEEFLESNYIKNDSKKIKDLISDLVGKVGEKVVLGKFYRIEI